MSLRVLRPGLLTTVQDLGRWGYQRYGIVVGGALDPFAARVANAMVGNDAHAAVIEMAQIGPDLRFETEALIAWCGAEFPVRVGGAAVSSNRAVRVASGEVISFGLADRGVWAWLAVAGGIDVPIALGSRSTYRRAGLGGHGGRALAVGDRLALGRASRWAGCALDHLRTRGERVTGWTVRPESLGALTAGGAVRVIRGPEWDWFTADAQRRLFTSGWRVTKDADRMGVRLEGLNLELREPREMISAGVNAGIVQVPPEGQPIVLLASRQSVGGYPRIAAVAMADAGRFAQVREGDVVRFEEVSLPMAHGMILTRERHLKLARTALARLFS